MKLKLAVSGREIWLFVVEERREQFRRGWVVVMRWWKMNEAGC